MKKNSKKLATILSALTLGSALLSGCTTKEFQVGQEDGSSQDKVLKIGIVQLVEHKSLDEIHQGIVDKLAEEGFVDGENIIIDYQNGQGDQSNLKTISQRFVNNKSDLIIAIATGAAQSVASETSDIPIIAASVTDMESAGLVQSMEVPGGNVTGVSDMPPVKEQIDILTELNPNVKTIGIMYCSSEVNSEVQVKTAQDYITSLGLEYVVSTVTTTNDIAQNLDVLTEKVDAVYIPVDNILASAMPTVMSICEPKKLPVIAGAAAMVEEGALASVAFDYYPVGVQSGEMAARILNGADPATTPIETVKDVQLYINKTYADEIGVEIPKDLLEKAEEVY